MATGPTAGDSWVMLFGAMREVRTAWPSRGWSWDGRMLCVTSSFSAELESKARAAAAIALTGEWTPETIHGAPTALRDVAERTGGLRAGQMILASATLGGGFAYGLWWPWGDGMTTSMRIGLAGAGVRPDRLQSLRDVFGVEL